MKKLRVLICSIWAGSGHNSAGDLYAQILKKDERFEVIRYISPTRFVDSHYSSITKYFPWVYNMIIKYAPTMLSDFITLYAYRLVDESVWLMAKEKPDIVIGTHFSQFQALKIAQRILKISPLSIETFLDYGTKSASEVPYNLYLRPDYSIVFDKSAQDWLSNRMRNNPQYYIYGGHKAREEFTNIVKKYKTKKNAIKHIQDTFNGYPYDQISSEKTTILITSGGGGTVQRVYKLLKKIAQLQKGNLDFLDKYQFFIICGSNKGFYDKIMRIRKIRLSWQNFFPFSWMDAKKYAHLQYASDYPVLYSVAPATMFELLQTKCLPIIVHKLRGGHEKGNADFIVNNNVGKYINRMDQLLLELFTEKRKSEIENYWKNADKIIEEETSRLEEFPEELVKIHDKFKSSKIYDRYKVTASYKFTSRVLIFIFSNLFGFYRFDNWAKQKYKNFKAFVRSKIS